MLHLLTTEAGTQYFPIGLISDRSSQRGQRGLYAFTLRPDTAALPSWVCHIWN